MQHTTKLGKQALQFCQLFCEKFQNDENCCPNEITSMSAMEWELRIALIEGPDASILYGDEHLIKLTSALVPAKGISPSLVFVPRQKKKPRRVTIRLIHGNVKICFLGCRTLRELHYSDWNESTLPGSNPGSCLAFFNSISHDRFLFLNLSKKPMVFWNMAPTEPGRNLNRMPFRVQI